MYSSYKILVVDDHKLSQKVLSTQLQTIGFDNIQSTSSGQEALGLLEVQKFDIVMFDLMMPEMDGFQFLQECKKNNYFKTTAFMLSSADADENNIMDILSEGAVSYITKPIFQEELKSKIQKVISWLEKQS